MQFSIFPENPLPSLQQNQSPLQNPNFLTHPSRFPADFFLKFLTTVANSVANLPLFTNSTFPAFLPKKIYIISQLFDAKIGIV